MTAPDLDELVARVREATSALIGGDIPRDFDLFDHADDFTLMAHPITFDQLAELARGPAPS